MCPHHRTACVVVALLDSNKHGGNTVDILVGALFFLVSQTIFILMNDTALDLLFSDSTSHHHHYKGIKYLFSTSKPTCTPFTGTLYKRKYCFFSLSLNTYRSFTLLKIMIEKIFFSHLIWEESRIFGFVHRLSFLKTICTNVRIT